MIRQQTFLFSIHLLMSYAPLWAAPQGNWPVDQKKTSLNETQWADMLSSLQNYPMKYKPPTSASLLVHASSKPWSLCEQVGWTIEATNPIASGRYFISCKLENEKNKKLIFAAFNIEENSLEASRKTIEDSFLSFQAARPSTWSESWFRKEPRCLSIPNASFVSNCMGDTNNRIEYGIKNIPMMISSSWDTQNPVSNSDLLEIANAFGSLIHDKPKKSTEYQGEELIFFPSVRKGDHVELRWKATGKLKDHWIKIDSEDGSLSILEEGRVALNDLPAAGTSVRCYAISPDGQSSVHKTIIIPPLEITFGN